MEIELLVRAVIEDQGRFLIAHSKGAENVYLPGGHLEPGEGMEQALARELNEELGIEVEVCDYLGAVEHAWQADGVSNHEINHCFVANSTELRATEHPRSQEDHVEFFWLPSSEFDKRNLQPEPLRHLISSWSKGERQIWWATTLKPDDI